MKKTITFLLCILPLITFAQGPWEFNTAGDTQGWVGATTQANSATASTTTVSQSGTFLLVQTTNGAAGRNPNINKPSAGIVLATSNRIEINLKNNSLATWIRFWVSIDGGALNGTVVPGIAITASDTSNQTYVVDISGVSSSSTITQIYLEFKNNNGSSTGNNYTPANPAPTIEIDYIRPFNSVIVVPTQNVFNFDTTVEGFTELTRATAVQATESGFGTLQVKGTVVNTNDFKVGLSSAFAKVDGTTNKYAHITLKNTSTNDRFVLIGGSNFFPSQIFTTGDGIYKTYHFDLGTWTGDQQPELAFGVQSTWSATIDYVQGASVIFQNTNYQKITNDTGLTNNPKNDPANWSVVGTEGDLLDITNSIYIDSIVFDTDGNIDSGFTDLDGDGFFAEVDDCDDTNAAINPNTVWYVGVDSDGDTFIGSVTSETGCTAPVGGVLMSPTITDCNDSDAAINPNTVWYVGVDTDGDTFIGSVTSETGCTAPVGGVLISPTITDCNDSDAAINPNTVWYVGVDSDGDTFIGSVTSETGCTAPVGGVLISPTITDCNDSDAAINPNTVWYVGVDTDGDTFIGSVTSETGCIAPVGGVLMSPTITDCDDSNSSVNSGATEILNNGIDDDCNPATPDSDVSLDIDDDGDGFTENQGDCDDTNAAINPNTVWYVGVDTDGDTFIGSVTSETGCTAPVGGVLISPTITDCNDSDAAINPNTVWYVGVDTDGDTFIGSVTSETGCIAPVGGVLMSPTITDCDDSNSSVNSGATEILNNGIDDDCNPATPDSDVSLDIDDDGDGFTENQGDCDDTNAAINPNTVWYVGVDSDGDTFIGSVTSETGCTAPVGGVLISPTITDCNDSDAAINPNTVWYVGVDSDGDTFIGSVTSETGCTAPVGGVLISPTITDCNDSDAAINPNTVWYVGVDTDGDTYIGSVTSETGCTAPVGGVLISPTITDCNDSDAAINPNTVWYVGVDTDGDTFIGSVTSETGCTAPVGGVLISPTITDCNDSDAAINPNTVWYVGVDSDGDTFIGSVTSETGCTAPVGGVLISPTITDCNDSDAAINPNTVWYVGVDSDGDTFIGSVTSETGCTAPVGGVLISPTITDCNDSDAAINPNTVWYVGVDTDGDTFIGSVTSETGCIAPVGGVLMSPTITDCDDSNSSVNSGATEILNNGIDDDCNPATPDSDVSLDIDDDGDGFTENQGDCDDTNAAINPNTVWYVGVDTDSDGFIGSVTNTQSCSSPGAGYALTPQTITDCNDNDAAVNTEATWYVGVDTDSDGFIGSVTNTQSCSSPGAGYALTPQTITDCNDNDAAVNTEATWYVGVDADSDGFIGSVTNTQSCSSPGAGYALTPQTITDCNDNDAAVNAEATWYVGVDKDGDGFFGSVTNTQSCSSPDAGYALTPQTITDCNDSDAAVNAEATWYVGVDTDGDGFIGSVTNIQSCSSPGAGYALTPQTITDCNDSDAAVNAETTWYVGVDADSDGFIGSVTSETGCTAPVGGVLVSPAIKDCDDTNAAVNPAATEVVDGIDNDCDGDIDEGLTTASIWSGAINTAWENGGNWQDANAPGLLPSDAITIPGGLTNYPVLTAGQDLTLAEGLSLVIENGASLGVSPTVVITNNGTITIDGSMTLKSDATGSAYIGAGTGTFIGDVTVERYIPAKRAYRQLSSPVTTSTFISNNWQLGTHITGSASGANGFDATNTGNPSMYTFDNVAYNYLAMANADATNLNAGQGYHILVRGDRTIDLSNNDAKSTETTLSAIGTLVAENDGSSTVTVDVPSQRFVFVGNPFQAPVDMNVVLTTAATNISPYYYWVWDPTLGSRGAYATVIAGSGLATAGDANQYLQAGQAGWVYTAAAGTTSLNFTQASKNTSVPETNVFKIVGKKASSTGQLRLSLYESSALTANQSAVDGILVLFEDNGNNALDSQDAPKFTNLDETFATSNSGTLLGIESRATPVDTDEIPLAINSYRSTNYTIVGQGTALQGATPYLLDAYTNVSTEIPQSGTVNYAYSINTNIAASMTSDRFKIIYSSGTLSVSTLDMEQIQLYPNPSNIGNFYLNIPNQMDDLEVTIYNVLGAKVFYKTGFNAGRKVSIETTFARDHGLYFVNLTSKGVTTTKKLIIKN